MVLKFTAEILFSVGEMNLSLKIYCKILINYSGISYRMLQTISTPRLLNNMLQKFDLIRNETKQNNLLL